MNNVDALGHYFAHRDAGLKQLGNPKETRILGHSIDSDKLRLDFESIYPGMTPVKSRTIYDLKCHCVSRSTERSVQIGPEVTRTYGVHCDYQCRDGFAIPSKHVTTLHVPGIGKPNEFLELEMTKAFERFEFVDDVPETEFTLTAFGFPEPVGVDWKKPAPRYVPWMLGLGGCAVVALVCRFVARRLQRRTAKPRV